ncbi:MAG: OmpA family protein [Bacteroidetes bacterium]|jgi:outer membrane protein OmpA-like peptidoglycan-associated protein|nr:OmpA family protein [Bacteroidota bacterium]
MAIRTTVTGIAAVCIGIIFNTQIISAQGLSLKRCPQTTSKTAEKKADEAEKLFKSLNDYDKALKVCNDAIDEDSTYAKPYMLMGDAAYRKKDFKTMAMAYRKLIEVCPDASEKAYYRLATYYYETKKYEEAIPVYKAFIDLSPSDTIAADDAEVKMFRAYAYSHPVEFKPMVVKGISTADPEYLPIISADNELCFFTRRFEYQSRNMLTPTSVEKFMISHHAKGTWERGEPMGFPFNKENSGNEGGASISLDNLHLFFTVNNKGNFDIYTSDSTLKGWTEPRSIGTANDPKLWDSQPSIAPDNRTLYFASFRDSINLTSDIYITVKSNGEWKNATPLSSVINTKKNEKSPFIHSDGKTLFFCSDGLPGMGGYDIFYSRKDEKGNWGKPVNLGYPINTEADEVGFFVSTDGTKGYFASNQMGTGGYDIFSFDLPEKLRPEKMILFKGNLKDEDNEVPDSARIEIKNIKSKQVSQIDYDEQSGKYAGVLEANADYILTVKKDDYAFNSRVIRAESMEKSPVEIDFEMQKMKEGGAYNLNDILFETDSYRLTDVSKEVINDFAEFLKTNPKLQVGIYGHTDNSGNAADNLTLSKNRAKAVYDYLISVGIAAGRLTHDGFGQTKPVAANTSEKGKALNRRTEFVILKK